MKKNFYYSEKNPKCKEMELNKKGYPIYKDSKKLVHRNIAWRYLLKKERRLKEWEEVHHIDGDKLNFHPDNLIILSKKDHWKISKRLHKEINLNKANTIIIASILFLFIHYNGKQWNWISRSIIFLLFIGILIPFYQNIASWIMKKTKLYKIISYED